MHITQESSKTPATIPPQLQGLQAMAPQLSFHEFEIPPEIAAIKIELNDLISFPVPSSVILPPCGPLLTTIIAREDIEKIERRFYPYLWFPDRAPYMLQLQDYNNILGQPYAGAVKNALKMIGVDFGTLARTASNQIVLFFQGEDQKAARDALMKSMAARNRSTPVRASDDAVGDDAAKRCQSGPPPDIPIPVPLPDAPNAVSGPSTSYPKQTVFAQTHTTESFPHPQNVNAKAFSGPKRRPRGRISAKSRAQNQTTPQQSQLEPGTEVTPKPKAQPRKRRVKKTQNPEPPQSQTGPSGTTVPEPIVPEVQTVHPIPQQEQVPSNNLQQVLEENVQVLQASGQYTSHQFGYPGNFQESVPFNGEVVSHAPDPAQASYPAVPVYPQAQFYDQQVNNNQNASGQGQARLPGPTISPFASGNNQPQSSHMEFDISGGFNAINFTDQEFSDLLNSTPMEQDFAYDNAQQVFHLQSQRSQGSAPGFDFTGEPFGGQPWNFEQPFTSSFPS